MMHKTLRVMLMAALPLGGLGYLWWTSDALSREGTVWQVPIEGYDPRDLLRGHYVEFRYDWPLAAEGQEHDRFAPPPHALCLYGDAPRIRKAVAIQPEDDAALEACAHKVVVDPGRVYGARGLERGRLYVGQARAKVIENTLATRDQRGIVTFRQRADGVLTPLDILFRPLTEAERAARQPDMPQSQ